MAEVPPKVLVPMLSGYSHWYENVVVSCRMSIGPFAPEKRSRVPSCYRSMFSSLNLSAITLPRLVLSLIRPSVLSIVRFSFSAAP